MLARRVVPARDLGAQDGGGGEAFKSAGSSAARSVPLNKKPPLPRQLHLPGGQVEGDQEVAGQLDDCHQVGRPSHPGVLSKWRLAAEIPSAFELGVHPSGAL